MASYSALQKLVVLTQLLAIFPTQARAQWPQGPAGNLCPSNFTKLWGEALATLGSVGLNNTELCTINGTLWNAVSSAQACLTTPTTAIPSQIQGFESLNSALSKCNSALTSSISASCAPVVAETANCTVSISVFGQPTPVIGFWNPAMATVSTSTTPTSTAQTGAQSTQQPTSTGSPSSTESSNQSNIGTVAGVAVGAALGAILIAATVAFFIWRCRRKAKSQRNNRKSSSVDDDAEKAQLPGDEAGFSKVGTNELGNDLSSDRKELAGPPVYARTVASLQELDGSGKHDKRISMKELASNEEVASEMATTEHSGSHTEKSAVS